MQITINTHVDDLPAIIRMLQAYCGPTPAPQTVEIAGTPADELYSGDALKAATAPTPEPDPTRTYTGCFNVEDYTQGSDIQGPAIVRRAGKEIATFPEGRYRDVFFDEPEEADHADEDEPTPEQALATVENYVGQAGGNGGNGQPPKSLFDAPLPPCDQTEKVGEATGVTRTPHSDVTVDAAGLPWDERIHASTKTKVADGTWKKKRGVDQELYDQVVAEISGAPKPPVAPPPPVTAPATETPAPAAPSAPPTPPVPKPITNAAELVAAVMDERFSTDQVNAACQAVGVENVASLLAKQDKLPAVLKELGV